MTSQYGKETIALYVLANISGSKGNQTIKFGHLIEYIMSIFFLKNHTHNVVEKLAPDPFLGNEN